MWLYNQIHRIVLKYHDVTFISNGSLGINTWAFEEVHRIRQEFSSQPDYKINNVLILPYVEHYRPWPDYHKAKMLSMIDAQATHVYYTDANRYKNGRQFYKCNEFIVDQSDGIIAVYDADAKDTLHPIDYAVERGVPILGYNPTNKKQFTLT